MIYMRFSIILSRMGIIAAITTALLVPCVQADDVNWALKDHYTIKKGDKAFMYAVESAEWGIEAEILGPLISNAGFSITLGDGTCLDSSAFSLVRDRRERFTNKWGTGTYLFSDLAAENGLNLIYKVAIYKKRPFITIHVEVVNRGEKPVSISEIACIPQRGKVFDTDLTDVMMTTCSVSNRGGFAIIDEVGSTQYVNFDNKAEKTTLALGSLTSGTVRSGIDLKNHRKSRNANIFSLFNPPLLLKQGKSVTANPVWVSYTAPGPQKAFEAYKWSIRKTVPLNPVTAPPKCWISVDDAASAQELYEAARAWKTGNIRHLLVPGSWQNPKPLFPKNMATVVKQMRKEGMTLGITFDPFIAGQSGKEPFLLTSDDGRTWINLTNPKGRAMAGDLIREIIKWQYQFIAIKRSTIPDDVLKQFGLTRAKADDLAFNLVREVALGIAVFPNASLNTKVEMPEWKQKVYQLKNSSLPPGPICLHIDGMSELDANITAVLSDYTGPVELLGVPKPKLCKQIARLFDQNQAPGKFRRGVSPGKPRRPPRKSSARKAL